MTSNTILSPALEAEVQNAGRRFRGASKARAIGWWNSQQNPIGFPYLDGSAWAAAEREFLRAAGLK